MELQSQDFDNKSSLSSLNLKLSTSQNIALSKCLKGKNVLICGSAGTGKSSVLNVIVSEMSKKKRMAVTSSTGVSANNLNSQNPLLKATTLHSWCKLKIDISNPKIPIDDLFAKFCTSRMVLENWVNTDVLIIDEISMITPAMLHRIHLFAKLARRNSNPFGGMQMILSGDWAQLPPVIQKFEVEKTEYENLEYCFELKDWGKWFEDENVVVLNYIFRQSNDERFCKLLNNIRRGNIETEDVELLKSRVNQKLEEKGVPIEPTHIYSLLSQVNKFNHEKLQSLKQDTIKIDAKYVLEGLTMEKKEFGILVREVEKKMNFEPSFIYRVGATVMLLINLDIPNGLVNGSQGVIVSHTDGFPTVQFENGKKIELRFHCWEVDLKKTSSMYSIDESQFRETRTNQKILDDSSQNTFNDKKRKYLSQFIGLKVWQIPLRIAFGITVHKSQSLTLSYVNVNLGDKIFGNGQAYTALSRVKTLKGLTLSDFNVNSLKVSQKVVEFYKKYDSLSFKF